MTERAKIRVAVNGYGVIGKRVADAVSRQPDMLLAGVADVTTDWRIRVAAEKGYRVFGSTGDAVLAMRKVGISDVAELPSLLAMADIVVDCTPKKVAADNIAAYQAAGLKFIVQGGEKHAVTGHSFVAESSYATALGRACTRVVSCNTTSIVRTLGALKAAGLLGPARGTLLRRATDPWESHEGGIMNTLVPEASIPSHQGPDAQSVDPTLDVVTMAIKVPETLAHVHYWTVRLARQCDRDDVLDAFHSSDRIALIRGGEGQVAINTVKEWMLDVGRPHGDLYEVYYAYMVDNQAIVIPETIDAIRAISATEAEASKSIATTNRVLGIGSLRGHAASSPPA